MPFLGKHLANAQGVGLLVLEILKLASCMLHSKSTSGFSKECGFEVDD